MLEPPVICFHRCKNLKDHLVRSTLPSVEEAVEGCLNVWFPILTNILKLLSILNNMTTDLILTMLLLSIKEKNIHERLFLEAWYSLKNKNVGNDHVEIPAVYKTLFS